MTKIVIMTVMCLLAATSAANCPGTSIEAVEGWCCKDQASTNVAPENLGGGKYHCTEGGPAYNLNAAKASATATGTTTAASSIASAATIAAERGTPFVPSISLAFAEAASKATASTTATATAAATAAATKAAAAAKLYSTATATATAASAAFVAAKASHGGACNVADNKGMGYRTLRGRKLYNKEARIYNTGCAAGHMCLPAAGTMGIPAGAGTMGIPAGAGTFGIPAGAGTFGIPAGVGGTMSGLPRKLYWRKLYSKYGADCDCEGEGRGYKTMGYRKLYQKHGGSCDCGAGAAAAGAGAHTCQAAY